MAMQATSWILLMALMNAPGKYSCALYRVIADIDLRWECISKRNHRRFSFVRNAIRPSHVKKKKPTTHFMRVWHELEREDTANWNVSNLRRWARAPWIGFQCRRKMATAVCYDSIKNVIAIKSSSEERMAKTSRKVNYSARLNVWKVLSSNHLSIHPSVHSLSIPLIC